MMKCDQCDKPATHAARDMMRHEDPMAEYVTFSPSGQTKYGCDEHPVTSEEFVTRLPVGKKS